MKRQLGSVSKSKSMTAFCIMVAFISLAIIVKSHIEISNNFNHYLDQTRSHHEATPYWKDEDFPYELTCKKSDLYNFLDKLIDPKTGKRPNFTVAIAFHVGMVNNWKHIVKDQITTLKRCGLLDIVGSFLFSYSNGLWSDLFHVLNSLLESDGGNFTAKIPTNTVKATSMPWEGPAMNMIHKYCNKHAQPQNAVVFYIHNKGASKWSAGWKETMANNITWTYGHSLYWRKYMEYFLIERPALCLDKILLQNASICGVNWLTKDHFSGNFWSAACRYIQRLEPMHANNSGYTDAEMWLGKNAELRSNQESHVASLHATTENLYLHAIKPVEYAITSVSNDIDDLDQSRIGL